MRRSAGRTAIYGALLGLATVAVAEAVRPRGGTSLLLDWDEVRGTARARLLNPSMDPASLAAAARSYRSLADNLEKPLLDFVGPLPKGASMPKFEALDREGWLDLNLGILRRVVDPVLETGRMPNSLIVEVGRAGVNRYVGYMLAFLGRRVLGQYDPQLLGAEPIGGEGLYLVETNVEEWQRMAQLPDEDLRRWLILHEMTHAWQFAAHPWLRPYMESSMKHLIDTVTRKGPAVTRFAAFAGVLPAQWRIMRQVQGTMAAVEGLIWKLTGLDLKLQQYRRGEAFCQAVYDKHGLALLNRVWDGPDSMPTLNELGNPEAWYRRTTGTRPPAARRRA